MERAAAMILGGVGLIVLTLAAVVLSATSTPGRPAGVELAALTTAPASPSWDAARPTTGPVPSPSTQPSGQPPGPGSSAPGVAAGEDAVEPPSPRPTRPVAPSPELAELLREISAGGIRFAVDRADLDPSAQRLLDRLAQQLAAEPQVVVVVRGHTDDTGTPTINDALSRRRAAAVVDHLVGRGVPVSQLVEEGLGSSEPVADNATAAGRQANRRSDVAAKDGD